MQIYISKITTRISRILIKTVSQRHFKSCWSSRLSLWSVGFRNLLFVTICYVIVTICPRILKCSRNKTGIYEGLCDLNGKYKRGYKRWNLFCYLFVNILDFAFLCKVLNFLNFFYRITDCGRDWYASDPLFGETTHVSIVAQDKWQLNQLLRQRVSF